MRTASGLRVVRISQSASSAAFHDQPPFSSTRENAAEVPHHGQAPKSKAYGLQQPSDSHQRSFGPAFGRLPGCTSWWVSRPVLAPW
ncbi:hypothetical protein D3C80_1889600 [compost metagenome]